MLNNSSTSYGSQAFWDQQRRLSDGSQVQSGPSKTKQVVKRFFSGPHPLRNLGLPNSVIASRTASPASSGSMSQKQSRSMAVPYGRI